MSHFAFGVIEGARQPEREAIDPGSDVCWGISLQQKVVLEMLAAEGKPVPGETPFSLTGRGENHADSLISPYNVVHEQIVVRLCRIIAWLDEERAGGKAELWLTEGYDDTFKVTEGSVSELQKSVESLLSNAVEVPSLRLRLR